MEGEVERRFEQAEERLLELERQVGDLAAPEVTAAQIDLVVETFAAHVQALGQLLAELVARDHQRDPGFWSDWKAQQITEERLRSEDSLQRQALGLVRKIVDQALDAPFPPRDAG